MEVMGEAAEVVGEAGGVGVGVDVGAAGVVVSTLGYLPLISSILTVPTRRRRMLIASF